MVHRPLVLIGTVISIVTGVAAGVVWYRWWEGSAPSYIAPSRLGDIVSRVSDSYVEELDEDRLMADALHGMLGHLDPHSTYLEDSDYDALQADTMGQFGGVGIELGLVDDYFTVIAPIDETPAARAGLEPGDRLVAVNGEGLKNKRLVDVVKSLRGDPNTEVSLKIRRQGEEKTRTFDLVRQTIHARSVSSRLIDPGFAYVRISQFQATTHGEFRRAIRRLAREANDGELDGLVLDLRNNPGGVLQASVDVADALLESGLIVYTEGRLPTSHLRYHASGDDILSGKPVVVLINQGSASAAEVVAGALQDHRRATLLGSRSFGKGSVQSLLPVGADTAIKLTTAYYYTPNGRSIHNQGIDPDVTVAPDEDGGAPASNQMIIDRAVALLRDSPLHAKR